MVKTSVWVNFEMNLLDVANLTRSVETETGRLIRTKLHVNSGMGKQPMAREWSGWLCKVDLLSIRSRWSTPLVMHPEQMRSLSDSVRYITRGTDDDDDSITNFQSRKVKIT